MDSVSSTAMGRGQFELSGGYAVRKMFEEENAQVSSSIEYLTSIFLWNTYFYIAQVEGRNEPTTCKMVGLTIVSLLVFFFAIYFILETRLLHHLGECLMAGRLANSWF